MAFKAYKNTRDMLSVVSRRQSRSEQLTMPQSWLEWLVPVPQTAKLWRLSSDL